MIQEIISWDNMNGPDGNHGPLSLVPGQCMWQFDGLNGGTPYREFFTVLASGLLDYIQVTRPGTSTQYTAFGYAVPVLPPSAAPDAGVSRDSGLAGMGGAAGSASGGAGGSGGAGSCTNTSCKTLIEASCQDGTSTQTISLSLDILNNSATPLPLSQVTVRYWFTIGETTDPPVLEVDYAAVGTAYVTSKFGAVSPAVSGANEYVELGFNQSAPSLPLFTDTGQIQIRLRSVGLSSAFDNSQTTDYSFQKCASGQSSNTTLFNAAPTITGYINGILVYGTEPH